MARFDDMKKRWNSSYASTNTTVIKTEDTTEETIDRGNKSNRKTPAGPAAGEAALKATEASAMSPYLDVLSDNMLRHKALPSSPETLCGKQVADVFRPSALDKDCDICMTLGDGFVNEARVASESKVECSTCGNSVSPLSVFPGQVCLPCWRNASKDDIWSAALLDAELVAMWEDTPSQGDKVGYKTSQVRDYALDELDSLDPDEDDLEDEEDDDWGLEPDDYELPDGDDVGTYINEDDEGEIEAEDEGGYFGLGDPNASLENSVLRYFSEDPGALKDFIEFIGERRGHKAAAAAKVALNYTLDGQKIVDGFKVMLTAQEAASMPYIDMNRVAISEKMTCSDCKEPSWLQTVASCRDCNEFKCASCMESMKDFSGVCRRCANTLDGTIGDESPLAERDLYFEYYLNNETESPLFLPEGE